MCDVQSVKILNCIQYLIKYSPSSSLFQSYFGRHNSKQLSLLCKLGDYKDIFWCLDDFIEVYDIRVPYFFHDLNLSLYANLVILIFNTTFIDYFDSDFFSCRNMNRLFYFSERALPQSLAKLVISYSLRQSRYLRFLVKIFHSNFIRDNWFFHLKLLIKLC